MYARKTDWNRIIMRMAAFLLVLTMVSTHLLSGMLAKYSVTESGGDSARVASFGELKVRESGNYQYAIVPGVAITKDPHITMEASEVAVYVFAKLELGDKWTVDGSNVCIPMGTYGDTDTNALSFTVDSGWTYLEKGTENVVFYRELAPNTDLDASLIKDDTVTVSRYIYYRQMDALTQNIGNITVTAYAAQAGGFADAASAWASVGQK